MAIEVILQETVAPRYLRRWSKGLHCRNGPDAPCPLWHRVPRHRDTAHIVGV